MLFWLEYQNNQRQMNRGQMLVDEVEQLVMKDPTIMKRNARNVIFRLVEGKRAEHQVVINYMLVITDELGKPIFSRPELPPVEMQPVFTKDAGKLLTDNGYQDILMRGKDNFVYKARNLQIDGKVQGHIYILLPKKKITESKDELLLMLILLSSAGILGWAIIYLLARRLAKPVQDLAAAAKQIIAGQFDINLNRTIKEKEVYELQESFKEMATRLQQLEFLRTRLLAGVTHELKTPVASISGLAQAVRDEVVTGETAKEFMDICFMESQRLHRMVDDLLDFNSFAVGAVHVIKENRNLNELLDECVRQWKLTQENETISIQTIFPEQQVYANTDSFRLQQVFINLFNNAKAAMKDKGVITVKLYEEDHLLTIDVNDSGNGIPDHEKPFIFENFFRGEQKQKIVQGMGLGLSLCKLIMRALDGEIHLKDSSSKGTAFTVRLHRDHI